MANHDLGSRARSYTSLWIVIITASYHTLLSLQVLCPRHSRRLWEIIKADLTNHLAGGLYKYRILQHRVGCGVSLRMICEHTPYYVCGRAILWEGTWSVFMYQHHYYLLTFYIMAIALSLLLDFNWLGY
jgi:hypothetical protein